MISFLGNIDAKVDHKGRVAIPAQFRKILQTAGHTALVLRKDIFQPCLSLYTQEVWEENIAQLRSRLNKWNERHQLLFRQFVMDVDRVEIDNSGRILIPKRYLQMVDIVSEVRFLGVENILEIWSKSALEQPLVSVTDFSNEIQELMNE
ncbi:MAG: division/cell wall cluster transcriptional repressor MraZ [Candidatus Azobacteroides sp.]|nr:division/cell wall cluster transcriptional repressor MraZ [Candidatus Azobacteroides sp.]